MKDNDVDDDKGGLTRKVSATSLKVGRVEYFVQISLMRKRFEQKGTNVGWSVKCLFKRLWDTLLNGSYSVLHLCIDNSPHLLTISLVLSEQVHLIELLKKSVK